MVAISPLVLNPLPETDTTLSVELIAESFHEMNSQPTNDIIALPWLYTEWDGLPLNAQELKTVGDAYPLSTLRSAEL